MLIHVCVGFRFYLNTTLFAILPFFVVVYSFVGLVQVLVFNIAIQCEDGGDGKEELRDQLGS